MALRTSRMKYTEPDVHTGDVVKVSYWESMICKTESSFQGVDGLSFTTSSLYPGEGTTTHFVGCFAGAGIVIGMYSKGIMRSIQLRNVVDGVPVELRIPLLSPLVQAVEVLRRRKRVTRRKLYGLREQPLQDSLFTDAALLKQK